MLERRGSLFACQNKDRDTIIFFFFFNDTATTEIYTLSLHDALPISRALRARGCAALPELRPGDLRPDRAADGRSRHGAGAVDPARRAGARGPRAQGRVQEAVLRPRAPGVHARPRERRRPSARPGDRAGP